MPNAPLSRLLADRLVGVVDRIRDRVHGALGTRQWKVEILTRTWSGSMAGEGNSITTILELLPNPQVRINTSDRLGPAGREPKGSIILSEVSLSYTEAELQPKLDARCEVAYRLTDMRGQRLDVKWGVLSDGPLTRRGDKEGDRSDWYLVLNESSPMTNLDGVNAP